MTSEGRIGGWNLNAALSDIPVLRLAAVTATACVSAQMLSLVGLWHFDASGTRLELALGQTIWNAAQVGQLIMLLCIWRAGARGAFVILTVVSILLLPFALYALSPGGLIFALVLLLTCLLAWRRAVPDVHFTMIGVPPRAGPLFIKFELIAFCCNLLCSLYNYNASQRCWPYWNSIYLAFSDLTGFHPTLRTVANALYGLGLHVIALPAYVRVGTDDANGIGAAVFALAWSVLPLLYVLYFFLLAKAANGTPGARFQKALCLACAIHFLFLTDMIAYKFGRGIPNSISEGFHWGERFAWRIAILLPLYQKILSRDWRDGNGRVGIVVHYVIATWAVFFFIYQVLIYDIWRLAYALIDRKAPALHIFGMPYQQALGYHGALVLMTLLYGFALLALRCKAVMATPITNLPDS